MIEHVSGNLLLADAEAYVNTVNTVGVMGKGIALQMKQAFPEVYEAYRRAAKANLVQPGQMLVVPTGRVGSPAYVINFPTKRHWKGRARIADIDAGLVDLVRVVRDLGIKSIAVPPLGCGNGGLSWSVVRPRIEAAFAPAGDVRVLLYAPEGAPKPASMPIATKPPNMTTTRAALIWLFRDYGVPGYELTLLEIQKLAYFLQAAGQPLKLAFTANKYGPYAEALNHVLQRMEGHFIRGYGDRNSGAEVMVLEGAVAQAHTALATEHSTRTRIARVSNLIQGFESPYGMELLATVHWIASQNSEIRGDVAAIAALVHSWSERKKAAFSERHVEVAWTQLRQEGWLD